MMPSTHYQHSGKAPFSGMAMTLVGGAVSGVVLAMAYALLIFWSPFVYVNAIMTLAFGGILAAVVGSLAKLGRIRSNGAVTVLALLVSLVAYFSHWVVWIGRITESHTLDLGQLWQSISVVAAMGPWSIFDWTPTGAALWAIWGIEALMIVGIGAAGAHGIIDLPYCETSRQWTRRADLPAHFRAISPSQAIESPQTMLDVLQPLTEPSETYTKVSVATAEGSALRCVTLKAVEIEQKDGKAKATEKELVKDMLFDQRSFEQLMQRAQPAG